MRRITLVLFLICFSASLFAFTMGAERFSKEPVVSVNLAKVFSSLDENSAYESKIRVMIEKAKDEEEKRKIEFEQMVERYNVAAGKDKKDISEEIDLYRLESDAWARFALRERDLEQSLIIEDKYRKIKGVVASLAKVNGWKVVLFDDSDLSFGYDESSKASRAVQFQKQILNRRILWQDQGVDVSDLVIDRMNNDYAANGKGS
tara:strand:- start:121 stop:732 length:612 start_codon:yes stop_codon:yes gene_type:complete